MARSSLQAIFDQISLITLMQIQDEQPSNLSLTELLSDKQNKVKVVRILFQALSSMGYSESASELQRESEIYPEEETESQIKAFFKSRQYQMVTGIVKQLHISSQRKAEVDQILTELRVMQLIQDKQYEVAIEQVMTRWPEQQERQLSFLTMISIDQPILEEEFNNRENTVLQKCITESFELKKSIDRMLRGYLNASDFQKRSPQEEQPFRKTVAESEKLVGMGKPSFLKLSPKGDQICLVSEGNREMQVSIWVIHGSRVIRVLNWKQQNFGNVNAVCWDEHGQKITINSISRLGIFNTDDSKTKIILESRNVLRSKILCCRWNSQGLLFIGGLTEAIAALDDSGKIVRTIRPFPKTREMVFNSRNELYSISATSSLATRYDLRQEKCLASFKARHCFMDLHLNEKAQTLVVTNKQHVYLLNSQTLEQMASLISPINDRMYKIEVFLVKDWLFVFNQKLTAVLQNHLVTRHHLWPDCEAVDVRGNKMVTVKSTIQVWQAEDALLDDMAESRLSNTDNLEEAEWYSQALEREQYEALEEMHSISSSQSSVSVEESNSSYQEEGNPLQIEYMQNEEEQEVSEQQQLQQPEQEM